MRGRKTLPSGKTQLDDLYFESAALGLYLREERLAQALSLRELEQQTGVSDSEIHKLETGSQECRLSSFIRICSALGVPPGRALDRVILSDYGFFVPRIKKDRQFDELCQERWKRHPGSWNAIAAQTGMFCSIAAHLLRCSNATRRATSFRYATDALRKAFTEFGEFIEQTTDGLERVNILKTLQRQPLREIKGWGLLALEFLDSLADGREECLWSPIFDSSFRYYELDDARIAKYHLAPVAAREWDDLRMRLRNATRMRGARSGLARRFKVSTAAVAQWLSGATAPSAETALQLSKWIEGAEAEQKKSAGRVSEARPAPTRERKARLNAKPKSSQKRP